LNREYKMKKKIGLVLASVVGCLILGALTAWWFAGLLERTKSEGPQCAPPSKGFSEVDLVGTWIAGTPDQRDILIIKADVTYKQIIHIVYSTKPATDYESGWQSWWLEQKDISVPVLHLEGWRMCGYTGMDCDNPGGSGSHMCQVEYKDAPGEGALYVMGNSELTLTLPLLENSYFYYRQKP
jgi:hypothetical protein